MHFPSIWNDDQDMEEQRSNKENQDRNIQDDQFSCMDRNVGQCEKKMRKGFLQQK